MATEIVELKLLNHMRMKDSKMGSQNTERTEAGREMLKLDKISHIPSRLKVQTVLYLCCSSVGP